MKRVEDKVLMKFVLKANGRRYALMATRYGQPNIGAQCDGCAAYAKIKGFTDLNPCARLGSGCRMTEKPYIGRQKYYKEIVE